MKVKTGWGKGRGPGVVNRINMGKYKGSWITLLDICAGIVSTQDIMAFALLSWYRFLIID